MALVPVPTPELDPTPVPTVPGAARAVVLGFRSAGTLPAAIGSLLAQDPGPGRPPLRVTLVLNGASAEVITVARALHTADRTGRLDLVHSEVNRGFAGGCNLGAGRPAGEEHLVFFNDDAEARPGWLAALLDFAGTHPRAGVIGGLLLFPDGRVQDAGGVLLADGRPVMIGRDLTATDPELGYARQVDYLTGAAILVRRSAFDAVGGFDERYHPAYYEDADLCLRIAAAGHECWYLPTAVVEHAESASTAGGRKQRMADRNELLFLQRWHPLLARRVPPGGADRRRLLIAAQAVRGGRRRYLVTGGRAAVATAVDLAASGARVDLLPTGYDERPDPAAGVRVIEDGPAEAAAPLGIGDRILVLPPDEPGLDQTRWIDLAQRIHPDATVHALLPHDPTTEGQMTVTDPQSATTDPREAPGTGHSGTEQSGIEHSGTEAELRELLGLREAALTLARDQVRRLQQRLDALESPAFVEADQV